jgi:hypothetical protein
MSDNDAANATDLADLFVTFPSCAIYVQKSVNTFAVRWRTVVLKAFTLPPASYSSRPDQGQRRISMIRQAVVAIAVVSIWTGSSMASTLAPTKPSQIISVVTGGGTCPNGDLKLDTEVNADGTRAAFSIPAGMVFVITEAQGRMDDGTITNPGQGHNGQVLIYRQGPSSIGEITVDIGPLGSNGLSRNAFSAPPHSFPTGVIVKSGTAICVGGIDLGTQASHVANGVVHGFLARDR